MLLGWDFVNFELFEVLILKIFVNLAGSSSFREILQNGAKYSFRVFCPWIRGHVGRENVNIWKYATESLWVRNDQMSMLLGWDFVYFELFEVLILKIFVNLAGFSSCRCCLCERWWQAAFKLVPSHSKGLYTHHTPDSRFWDHWGTLRKLPRDHGAMWVIGCSVAGNEHSILTIHY